MRVVAATLSAGLLLTGLAEGAQVRVPSSPSLASPLKIGFSPHKRLPRGGYYYAVLVLEGYPHYSAASPPPCAVSSDMSQTPYAYAHKRRSVELTVLPAPSDQRAWCAAGTYVGAVYSVPHRPRCGGYTCRGSTAEYGSACWEVEPGHRVCGVVAKPPEPNPEPKPEPPPEPKPEPTPTYSFPGGLPKPLDRTARVVARFEVTFGAAAAAASLGSSGSDARR
jgi:hypothetical protein